MLHGAMQKPGLPSCRLLHQGEPSTGWHLDWLRTAESLSEADCDEIIAACRDFSLVPPNTVDEAHHPGRRQADVRKIGINTRTQWLFDLLGGVAAEASRTASGLELSEINRAPQYLEYRPGWGHFDWHNDYSHHVSPAPRKLTIIIQLSAPTDYEGGRLQMFGTTVEDLPAERGSVLAFPSFLYHRVTPVTGGVRRALVAWIAGPRLR
jgi:predicted 2-oxoglutarate/Fe(II)-dependent dioxygenase YbiX